MHLGSIDWIESTEESRLSAGRKKKFLREAYQQHFRTSLSQAEIREIPPPWQFTEEEGAKNERTTMRVPEAKRKVWHMLELQTLVARLNPRGFCIAFPKAMKALERDEVLAAVNERLDLLSVRLVDEAVVRGFRGAQTLIALPRPTLRTREFENFQPWYLGIERSATSLFPSVGMAERI